MDLVYSDGTEKLEAAEQAAIRQRLGRLGQWFHNIDLKGVPTAPDHFLGDYPNVKWQSQLAAAMPQDLTGKTVLDIGCNGGFYSIQMKRRGAERVLGIDSDSRYLDQASFAAEVYGVDIEFRQMSVYDIEQLHERFDLVLFMGVLYHLRHPLLALDLLAEHVVKDTLIMQSLLRGNRDAPPLKEDHPFSETELFDNPSYPEMHFIEHRYAGDPTNWWIPNRACVLAMLRSSGFQIESEPDIDVFVCRLDQTRSKQFF